MRKFLFALCISLLSLGAAADDLPAVAGLKAFRQPMEEIVREAGKGRDADFGAFGKSYAEADTAWKLVVSEPLDLDHYGVASDRQEEVWRQVRTLGMLMGYMDEAIKRGDRALMLGSADMLQSAYTKLAAGLGVH